MKLSDSVNMIGVFSITSINKDGTSDKYVEKNLIMNSARSNMAQIIGGQSSGTVINKIVLGTQGFVDNILNYKKVGENDFDSTRTSLFSEELNTGSYNYSIDFDTTSAESDVTVDAAGKFNLIDELQYTDTTLNTVQRVINDRTITYTVTIPADCANSTTGEAIAYTEAALYTGNEIFSMKCFPARVKEDSVKLIINWSIIF